MKEEKSVVYTLILGVCMLLCLLLIGKMLLQQPVRQPAEPPEEEGEDEQVELQLSENDLGALISEALPLTPNAMTVRIGAHATVEVSASVSKQALTDSGLDAGMLRTAAMFLPDPCKLYGSWQVSVKDGALCLAATRAEIAGIALPDQVVSSFTNSLAETVNQKLADWGLSVNEIASENGCLLFRP